MADHRIPSLLRERRSGRRHGRIGDRRDTIGLLDQEPASRPQRCGYFFNRLRWLRQKHQHGARVYKVEFSLGKRFAQNIVAPDFQVRRVDRFKKTRLKIGRDDMTAAPYLAAKPFRDGAASASYF